MKKYGLLGRKLGHSYSQRWFEELFSRLRLTDYHYGLYELSTIENLRGWVKDEGLSGFNVTVPYKMEIIPQLDRLDTVAEAVRAVNCVTVEDGRLIGHNTDAPAFQQTLGNGRWSHAYILGTGGASRAVAYALGQLGISFSFVSRNKRNANTISYGHLFERLQHAASQQISTLIVNATPVGMYPDINNTPLNLSTLLSPFSSFFFYDLTYNPSPTLLMRQAAALGAQTKDGLEMLHLQAELSWDLFKNEK